MNFSDLNTHFYLANREQPEEPDDVSYQVKEGDILIKIMRSAGLPDRANLYCTDHPENAWIARYKQANGTMTLKLWPRYRPPYKGEYLPRSTGSYPVIYIPTLDEYKKSRWYR